jgi:uncharacterized membrane protein
MEAGRVRFVEWIQRGFDLYKDNLVTLIAATAVAAVLSIATLGILAGPMAAGLIFLTLGLLDKREPKPQMSDVFKGFDWFLQSLLYVVVWAVILNVVGLIVLAAPFVGPLLHALVQIVGWTLVAFALFLIVDKKMDFWAASMASVRLVATCFFPVLALVIVTGLLASIGLLACGVGVFVTAPLKVCILAVAYRELFKS